MPIAALMVKDGEKRNDETFFDEAYDLWGPVVDAVKKECDLDDRDRVYEIRVSQHPPNPGSVDRRTWRPNLQRS